jgi:hypothetical protein
MIHDASLLSVVGSSIHDKQALLPPWEPYTVIYIYAICLSPSIEHYSYAEVASSSVLMHY